jgi:hypothetical protein
MYIILVACRAPKAPDMQLRKHLKSEHLIEVKNLINTNRNKQKIAKSEPKTQPNDA